MKLSGEERIGASPAAVWAALIDPEVLAPLIPGCESMAGSPATGYDLAASRSVAGLEVRLTGRVDLTASRPGEGCDLVASGSGGRAGGARGTARIRLQPDGEGTRLRYDLDAAVEGGAFPHPRLRAARRGGDGWPRGSCAASRRPSRRSLAGPPRTSRARRRAGR